MSDTQFKVIMAAIQTLTAKVDSFETRFDKVEAQLVDINGELKRIEHWTPYNANNDVMAELTAINGRK
jgi:hypothetical protein